MVRKKRNWIIIMISWRLASSHMKEGTKNQADFM